MDIAKFISFRVIFFCFRFVSINQGDHSPGKVREFQSGQGKVRENGKSPGKVRGSEIRCVFSSSKYSKSRFSAGALPWTPLRERRTGGASLRRPPDPLVGWGVVHPIPFPQLLQPQLLNN